MPVPIAPRVPETTSLVRLPVMRSTTIWPRMPRRTKSCTECQKRKQKCNQERPCSNCKRRFPEPVCVYGSKPSFPTTRPPHSSVADVQPGHSPFLSLAEPFSGVRTSRPNGYASLFPNPWFLASPLAAMVALPIAVTKQTAVLIHTFGEILYHLKGSFDGTPDDDNPFLVHYVPWCVQSPLLVHTSLYISAQPLAERHFLDEATTTYIRVNAIRVLSEHLRTPACTGDEAMGAVTQFISIEFYYGSAVVMRAHLDGLRQMICLRGGFSRTRIGVLITKVALVGDCIIALSLESPSILQATPTFPYTYDEPSPPKFKVAYCSPLLAPRMPFAFCVDALGLHPAAAWILDQIGFLVNLVLSLPSTPSAHDLIHLHSTSAWVCRQVTHLSADAPDAFVATPSIPPDNDDDYSPRPPRADSLIPSAELDDSADDTGNDIDSAAPQAPTPYSLLPKYPSFSAPSRSSSSPSTSTSGYHDPTVAAGAGKPLAVPLYLALRLTALIYARAIRDRQPFSAVCSDNDALAILAATWRVPLNQWRDVTGIFIFIMAALVPTLHQRSDQATVSPGTDTADRSGGIRAHVHTRFAKSILQIGLMNVSLEDWPACNEMMSRALRLQRWLCGDTDGGANDT